MSEYKFLCDYQYSNTVEICGEECRQAVVAIEHDDVVTFEEMAYKSKEDAICALKELTSWLENKLWN